MLVPIHCEALSFLGPAHPPSLRKLHSDLCSLSSYPSFRDLQVLSFSLVHFSSPSWLSAYCPSDLSFMRRFSLTLCLTASLPCSLHHFLVHFLHGVTRIWCLIVCWCSVTQSCLTLCNPMDCSTPGFPVHHQLPELVQTHVHRVGDALQPSYPLSSPSLPAFNLSQH